MAASRVELRVATSGRIPIKELEPGEFGIFDNGRIVYQPFGEGPPQAFDGGYFSGFTRDQVVRKLQKGEVVEITVQ